MIIDSHAHLCDSGYKDDLESVLVRAQEAGVSRIVDVGYNPSTIERSKAISGRYAWIYSAFGFHPHDAQQIKDEDFEQLKQDLRHPRCVAMGEMGLDFFKQYSPRPMQEKALGLQLEIAQDVRKPVIFHSRGAEAQVLSAAQEARIEQAVFHCFTGPEEIGKKIIDAGYYLSFAGFITYPKGSPDWLGQIPRERILVETDCPYLSPVPFRGKRNEPSYLKHTAARLAEAIGLSPEEVCRITAENAARFFQFGA